ncbi:MAG: penicillin-binding protein 2 [Candidatus Omnitrophica bacterium]|nr:penicillin-binding protein 2 [Candidatus Omnitrophota bacterium]
MRLKILRIIIIIGFILVATQLIYVQAVKGRYYFDLSTNNRIRVVPLEGWRGRIFDRNGNTLAENRLSYNVMITPQTKDNSEQLFEFLGKTLNIKKEKLIKKYQSKKHSSFAPVLVAEDITREQAIVLEENRFRFSSLLIEESFERSYPLNENSAHIIGYVGKVNDALLKRYKEYGYSPLSSVGITGVEEFYDLNLRGEEGGYQIEVNSRGQQVRILSIREPTRGNDITLTIDSRIQEMAHLDMQGRPGAIIIMDYDNGEILGMTSSPTFNPNIFVDSKLNDQVTAVIQNPQSPLLNRAINGRFPPGSVFKLLVSIGALDSQKINRHTTFFCPGYHELGGKRFGCTAAHNHQNVIEAIAHSCNVFYYHLGLILGADSISHYAEMFGLGELTHVDLPHESQGNMPNSRQGILLRKRAWFAGDTLNLSIGQGDVLTTPLQLVRMVSLIARDGTDVVPHLIKEIAGVPVDKYRPEQKVKIGQNIFDIVKEGMRAVVTDEAGTAHELYDDRLYIAGKTGTAQSSRNKEHHAWFAGYAKGKNKNIAFCVFLEHGGTSHNAVAITKELLFRISDEGLI